MRNKRLDIVRCLAIVMVILHHANIVPLFTKAGWVGVDLFFVLSGFLVSGLLYSEYKKRQAIGVCRFLIRRGLKIYPAFYVMLLATLAAQLLFWKHSVPLRPYLYEIFFVQNYHFGIWNHTWSLAVEEHFYVALALLLLVLSRSSAVETNPFGAIPRIFFIVAGTCLFLRIFTIWITPAGTIYTPWVMNLTHCRIDGLFFGVFLGYLYHFHPERLQAVLGSPVRRNLAIVVSAALLSCCIWFTRDDHFLLTFGLSFLYLGFGLVLMLALHVRDVLTGPAAAAAARIGTTCAAVGTYSYSIYLWHMMVINAIQIFLRKSPRMSVPGFALLAVYLFVSIALGICSARLIEFPVLRLRDRVFPAMRETTVKPAITSVTEGAVSA